MAILGALTFAFGILANINRSYGEASNPIWLLGLALLIQGLLGYGLLNAIADIDGNMIDVGNYVRELRKQNKNESGL